MSGVSDNALDALHTQIREKMNQISDNMICGACKDFADYTHQVGQVKGLAMAERELLDIVEAVENA